MDCNRSIRSTINKVIINMMVVVMTSLLALVCYWSFKDYKVIEYKTDKFIMQKDEYAVGEPLTYKIDFCKYSQRDATVLRFVRDTVIYSYPSMQSDIKEGCSSFISSSNITPNVPTGMYVFENVVIYQVNPIRTVEYRMESTPFKIINPNE